MPLFLLTLWILSIVLRLSHILRQIVTRLRVSLSPMFLLAIFLAGLPAVALVWHRIFFGTLLPENSPSSSLPGRVHFRLRMVLMENRLTVMASLLFRSKQYFSRTVRLMVR